MQKSKSKRLRQTKKICNFRRIKEKIKKAQASQQGASQTEINSLLSCVPNFIGCFAENELENMIITSFPCFLVVNIDHDQLPGSHWIALNINRTRIEIWDSLGFRLLDWPRIPCTLLKFLHKIVVTRRVIVSRRMQSSSSHLCGFYCIFFIIYRQILSFTELTQYFTSNLVSNDRKLIKLFS